MSVKLHNAHGRAQLKTTLFYNSGPKFADHSCSCFLIAKAIGYDQGFSQQTVRVVSPKGVEFVLFGEGKKV